MAAAYRRRGAANNAEVSYSPEAEAGLISCALQRPALLKDQLQFTRPDHFYDLRHGVIWRVLRNMSQESMAIDLITVIARLKKEKLLEQTGGITFLNSLADAAPSPENASYYKEIILEKLALRKTREVCTQIAARCEEWRGNVGELLEGARADIETVTSLKAGEAKPLLRIWRVDELREWQAPDHLRLIGDNEICMGYEGLALIAGPGSSGKSLAAASLALAGAIGSGFWFGRKVHRPFRTLILQAENGPVRLKGELEAMQNAHPQINLEQSIFVSDPPEGGLPFHKPEFRVAVRRQVEAIKPALVVLDPWSQIATEDTAKDVVDKLAEIRSCFPAGDLCPGLLIIAHTKKPRPEDVRRGRALTNLVSGSIALPNTARCVYLLLPWDEELEEDRVYWACSKLNNGEMYAASVWRRRFGTFFELDSETDARDWGIEPDIREENRALEPRDLIAAFGSEHVLSKSTLAKRIEERINVGYSTTMRAITGKGYLAAMIEKTPEGWIKLKDLKDGKDAAA